MLEDVDTLIMSPALFATRPIHVPADVEGRRFLASETRPGDWVDWIETAGLPHLAGRPRQVFDRVFVTRQTVEDGLGLGIGPLPMLDADIASGRLVTPLPHIRVRRTGDVALTPHRAEGAVLASRFVDWLAAEGG